ncbi:MAG: nitrogen regulatory protein [Clostridia bacterium]|nr:nitrogen regulatory protein [Clostridia bacterium]
MEVNLDIIQFEMLCVIVNFGIGSKVIKIAKHNGITGGTVLLGKGTEHNRILEFLELSDMRKEIVFMLSDKTIAQKAIENIYEELNLKKPHHGIAFSSSVLNFFGSHNYNFKNNINTENRSLENIMYNAIFTVVDKGKSEFVIEAAIDAGSKGGTIINARGSGTHEVAKLFNISIEPEKEIILILSERNLTEKITDAIRKKLNIDEPGKGIMFILDVNKTYGLY